MRLHRYPILGRRIGFIGAELRCIVTDGEFHVERGMNALICRRVASCIACIET